MSEAAALYDRDGIWGNVPDTYQELVRRDILAVIPAECGSVLDVGCGDGYITNALPAGMRVVGLDVGEASLRHVKRERSVGLVTALPFADGEFDLVMANDVIEHIPDADFAAACAELRRVARRWVLLTVPLMERLEAGMTACPACGTVYHVNHHQRRFDVGEAVALLGDGWVPDTVVFSGTVMGPAERATRLLRARSGRAGAWEHSRCPACSHEGSAGSLDDEVLPGLLQAALECDWPSLSTRVDRSECICLFRRGGGNSRAIEEVPRWALVEKASPGIRETPGTLGRRGQHIVCVPGDPPREEAERFMLQCTSAGVLYRLPDPVRIEGGAFDVPLWFLPPSFGGVRPAELDAPDILFLIAARERKARAAEVSAAHAVMEAASAQLIDLWEMHVMLRAQVAAQADEIRHLKELLGREADVRHRRDR